MLWKIYFWFLAISVPIGYLGILSNLVKVDLILIHIFLIALGILRPIAVYSYVFKKSIFKTVIWKVIFWLQALSISFEVIDSFFLKINLIPGVATNYTIFIIAIILLLPSIYATYKLAYPKKK